MLATSLSGIAPYPGYEPESVRRLNRLGSGSLEHRLL